MSGQRKALIVANDEYQQDALRNLLAPEADAKALGQVLGDRQIGGFTVQVVRNQPSYVIQAQIEDLFSESSPDDVLLLHFSGHGLKNQAGELFFAAVNTRPNRLGSTAVSADFVQRCMQASRSRSIVLFLDCCYGGAFAQGVTVRASGDVNVLDSFPPERTGGRGRAVITASTAMEYALEGDQLADAHPSRPSVFTSALVEGLATGDADLDEDGWVSLNELYDYVFDKVHDQNPHQTPSRATEMQGELYLARSRRRRIQPAPLPPDLQAAMTDPNMYTRLGAISELRSRLIGDNLPAAAGAYEALAELARTDVRYVADPAADALNHAVLRPEETQLDFGDCMQGSEPPHRLVRLLGPPIARFCAPRASEDWIHINEAAEGLDISVDTNGTGSLHANLDLKGATGEVEIAIDINLISPSAPQVTEVTPSRSGSTKDLPPADSESLAPEPRQHQTEYRARVEKPYGAETAPYDKSARAEHGPEEAIQTDGGHAGLAQESATRRLEQSREQPQQPAKVPSAWHLLRPHILQVGQLVYAVAFSPETTRLAIGSRGRAFIWDLQTDARVLELHAGRISTLRTVAFSPNGKWLAAGGSDRTARVWDAATGKQQHRLNHNGAVTTVAFNSGGTRLASGSADTNARIWDATGRQRLRITHPRGVTTLAFSPDGARLATGSEDATVLWDTTTGQQQLQILQDGNVQAVAFSPDGAWLATGSTKPTVRIWDATTGQQLHQLTHTDGVTAVVFSPDGAWLAAGSANGTVRFWDATTGRQLHQLTHTDGVAALAFSPDGARLAVVWGGKTVHLWDIADN